MNKQVAVPFKTWMFLIFVTNKKRHSAGCENVHEVLFFRKRDMIHYIQTCDCIACCTHGLRTCSLSRKEFHKGVCLPSSMSSSFGTKRISRLTHDLRSQWFKTYSSPFGTFPTKNLRLETMSIGLIGIGQVSLYVKNQLLHGCCVIGQEIIYSSYEKWTPPSQYPLPPGQRSQHSAPTGSATLRGARS